MLNAGKNKPFQMIILASLVYFSVVSAGAMLLLYPGLRGRLAESLCSLYGAGTGRAISVVGAAGARAGRCADLVITLAASTLALAGRRPFVLALGVTLITIPTLLVILLKGPRLFQFSDEAYIPDGRISKLLAGEHLAPPPPLLPETFLTREVRETKPEVASASRNWARMDEEFNQRLLRVFKFMREQHGYEMVLLEGYRSPTRQAQLSAQGRHVTQAGAYMSYHQYGLAADCAFYRDGKLVISERDPWAMRGYQLYGQLAERMGLTWGGRWTMSDLGHVELRREGVLGQPTDGPVS